MKNNNNISSCDVIFVGTRGWWCEIAPAVKAFLSENKYEVKIMISWIAHEGGNYQIKEEIGNLEQVTVRYLGKRYIFKDEDIRKWFDGLK